MNEALQPHKKEAVAPVSKLENERVANIKTKLRQGENIILSFLKDREHPLSPVEKSLAMIEARVWEKSLSMSDREGGKTKVAEYAYLSEQYLKEFGIPYEPIIQSREQAQEFLEKYLGSEYIQEEIGEHTPEEVITQLERTKEKVSPESIFEKSLV